MTGSERLPDVGGLSIAVSGVNGRFRRERTVTEPIPRSEMRTNRTYAGAAVADAALVRTRGAFIAVSQLMSPYRSIRGPDCA